MAFDAAAEAFILQALGTGMGAGDLRDNAEKILHQTREPQEAIDPP